MARTRIFRRRRRSSEASGPRPQASGLRPQASGLRPQASDARLQTPASAHRNGQKLRSSTLRNDAITATFRSCPLVFLSKREGIHRAPQERMAPIHTFTDLTVWQRSMALVVDVYRLTDGYPKSELYGLTSQTRRSSISIPSNIAEGFCRASTPTYINHLNIALGSEGELFTQLECGRRLGFATDLELEKYFDDLSQIGKMLRGLVRSLERSLNAGA